MSRGSDCGRCREWSPPEPPTDNFRRPSPCAVSLHGRTSAPALRERTPPRRPELFAVVLVVDVAADARSDELRVDAVPVHVGDRLQDEPVILRIRGPLRPVARLRL